LVIVTSLIAPLLAQGAWGLIIVVPDDCPERRQTVAADLADTLAGMTGIRPTVAKSSERPEGPAILLGDEFAPAAVQATLTDERIGFDGYVIRSLDEQTLLLCGRKEGGHSNAAYGWLRELGCRWFMPGPHGEVIPKVAKVELADWDRVEKPAWICRQLWYSGA